MFDKRESNKVITLKTIFILYLSMAWYLAYTQVVVYDQRYGQIYSFATLFALSFFFYDYFLSLTNAKKSYTTAMVVDILDQVVKFPDKNLKFKPSYKGFVIAIVVGFLLFSYFWSQTQATGAQFSGVPSLTNIPSSISLQDKGIKAGLVAIPEDSMSIVFTSLIMMIFLHIFRKVKFTGLIPVVIAILISSWISAFVFIVPLHDAVYGLNEPAKQSVGKFFFVGNVVSMGMGNQYSFDLFHFLWNKQIVESGTCIGSGCG